MQVARGVHRSFEEGKILNLKKRALFVALLALAVFLSGCGGDEQAQDEPAGDQSTREQTTDESKTEKAAGTEARMEQEKAEGESAEGEGPGQEATLEIEGDPGTRFSGTCSLGDKENEIGGQVPQSFTLALEGQKLECEIQGTNEGNLKVLLTAPGNRIVQETNAGTIKLTYSGNNGASSSATSSSSSSNSVSQVINQSSSR